MTRPRRGWRQAAVALVLALLASGCRSASPAVIEPSPTAEITRVAPGSPQEIDIVVSEVMAALDAARGLQDALRQASADPNWDRVARACRPYPLGPVDPTFGVRLTQGLRSTSTLPTLWPEQVVAVDSAAATTCFITGAAGSIPPGSRVDEGGPTTAEIAGQALQAAFEDLRDTSPQALRALVEARRRSGV